VLRAAPEPVIVMGADGRVRDWNPAAEITFGYSRAEAIGNPLAELIVPGPLRAAHRDGLSRYVETGETKALGRRLELSGMRRDGSEFPVELTLTALPGFDPPLFVGFLRDLGGEGNRMPSRETDRLQQRMAFLAQTSLVLDRSLDYNETLRTLADLTVPELAQLTVVDLLGQDGSVHTAVAAAPDPAHAREIERMREAHPLTLDGSHPVAAVLRSAQPVLLPSMTPAFLRNIAQASEHFELMRRLQYHTAIVVPLIARQHALGTLSLLRMDGSPSYNQDDLVLAEELARRAAMAIDNARLFEATRHIARTLQASLLPQALPSIPGVRLAGHYRAAAADQEVGGDFYTLSPSPRTAGGSSSATSAARAPRRPP
jgi:PAS domain S-box-containing protein